MIRRSHHTHDFVFKSIEKAATPGGQRNALEFSASSHNPGDEAEYEFTWHRQSLSPQCNLAFPHAFHLKISIELLEDQSESLGGLRDCNSGSDVTVKTVPSQKSAFSRQSSHSHRSTRTSSTAERSASSLRAKERGGGGCGREAPGKARQKKLSETAERTWCCRVRGLVLGGVQAARREQEAQEKSPSSSALGFLTRRSRITARSCQSITVGLAASLPRRRPRSVGFVVAGCVVAGHAARSVYTPRGRRSRCCITLSPRFTVGHTVVHRMARCHTGPPRGFC